MTDTAAPETDQYDPTTAKAAAAAIDRPLQIRALELKNRLVMSPMTRSFSPGGIPGQDVADYYRRRAEGGTGLIVTEGVAIDHPFAVDNSRVPVMYGDEAMAAWRTVVDEVHAAGGKIVPQLWHVGPLWGAMRRLREGDRSMRPSGRWGTPGVTSYPDEVVGRMSADTEPMTEQDIQDVISAYARSARYAAEAGFDGIAIHGGHGYLLDAFMWADTNRRDDHWGGDVERRANFPAAVVAAIRKEIGDDLPIIYRFSQHKQQDFTAKIAEGPEELGVLLGALVEAGADVLDASIRRFDVPAFEGSDLSLAGWAKKLTGAKTMAVGSFGIGKSLRDSRLTGQAPVKDNRAELARRLGGDEFDLIAVGRLHLAEPELGKVLTEGRELPAFDRPKHEGELY